MCVMEPLFAGVWISLGVAAIVTCLSRGHENRFRRKRNLAVLCLLTLLFPVISIADNLCYEPWGQSGTIESWTAGRRVVANEHSTPIDRRHVPELMLFSIYQNPLLQTLGVVTAENDRTICFQHATRIPERSPPSLV
jgi:hypothetical protein